MIGIPHEVVQELYALSQQIREHEEAIEKLRAQQVSVLAQLNVNAVNAANPAVSNHSAAGNPPLRQNPAGHQAQPTLNNAIVDIFRKNGNQPLHVRQILEELVQSGFAFQGQDPGKTLTIRIYQCRDVERLGDGQFRAQPAALSEAAHLGEHAGAEYPKKRRKGATP